MYGGMWIEKDGDGVVNGNIVREIVYDPQSLGTYNSGR